MIIDRALYHYELDNGKKFVVRLKYSDNTATLIELPSKKEIMSVNLDKKLELNRYLKELEKESE